MRGCDARDQLRSGTCDWRVMLLVCAIALVGQVGLSMVSDDWPVGQVRLPSTGGEEVVLSIHAGGSSGGVVSEMNESMYVARLGQPIAGRSSGGGLQLIHGAIGTYRVVGLAKPVQLFAEAVDGYHVHLDWVDTVAGETGFKIERRYSDGVYEHIGSVGANEVIYEDKDVLPGEFYIYRVRAVMDELAGGYSNEASAATPLAGDVNMDGVVSIIDLARLASNFNKIVNSWEDGDLNGDGIVNISDLAKLASRFGEVHEDWGKLPDGSISVIRRYTIIDLGTLGGIESVAMDVNKDLKVVGYSLTTNSRLHSFEWEDGLLTDTNPEAALSSRGYAVNEGGVVAGQHRQLSNLIHATLWSTSGVMSWVTVDEDLLFGRSINDDGVMVGYAAISHPSEGLSYRAFKVENQIVQWLIDDESEKTWAMDVNNDGLAAGYVRSSEGVVSAALYDTDGLVYYNAYGSEHAMANALNEYVQLVGEADDESGHAIATMWYRNEVIRLGTLGGDSSTATDVNADAEIVGYAKNSNGDQRAFVYSRLSGMHDLNTLIDTTENWMLLDAMGINDEGYIVGKGQINGETHAYLLVPVGE